MVFGCSKRSGRDKDVSFYRTPKVITNKGKDMEELTLKRHAGFISAISILNKEGKKKKKKKKKDYV